MLRRVYYGGRTMKVHTNWRVRTGVEPREEKLFYDVLGIL